MFRSSARRLLSFALAGTLLAGCGLDSLPPATLSVRTFTPVPSATARVQPTATPLSGLELARPLDPAISALIEQVQPARLEADVAALAGFQTRHVLSASAEPGRGIGAARDWLIAQFEALRDVYPDRRITVERQSVNYAWRVWQIAGENVFLTLPGREAGAGVYVVGAHYDSISSDPFNGNLAAPGANDNASGVAAMLEIARILAANPTRATLIFVAFTAEETGRQGSQTFVETYLRAQNPPIPVRGMINLDTIGSELGSGNQRDGRTLRLFSAPPNHSDSRQFARQLSHLISAYVTDLNVALQTTEDREGRWGDQMSFTEAGYPAIRFIQALENPNVLHSPRDLPDSMQIGYLERATRAVLAGLASLADGLPPPTFFSFRRENPGTLTLIWPAVPGAGGYQIMLRRETSLVYDQVFTVPSGATLRLEWDGFARYDYITMAAIDPAGRVGAAASEQLVSRLLAR